MLLKVMICFIYSINFYLDRNVLVSFEEIMNYNPDGVFLSNGPGDPFKTGEYALPVIKDLLAEVKLVSFLRYPFKIFIIFS